MDNKRIINLLKKNAITYVHRICFLNPDESVAFEIPQSDIIIDSISYSENLQNGERRTLSFKLFNGTGKYLPSVNSQKGYYTIYYDKNNIYNNIYQKNNNYIKYPLWGVTKFSYEIGIKINNTDYVWFPKGIFILSSADAVQKMSQKEISLSLKDKYSLFNGRSGKLLTAIEIPSGSNGCQVIKDLLNEDFGNGYTFDTKEPIFDLSLLDFEIQASIKKDSGNTMGNIIEDVALQMNAEFYYNENGNFVLTPINDTFVDSEKPLCWEYSDVNGDLFDVQNQYNFEEAINIINVVGANIENGLYKALAVNNDSRSPICVGNIGKRYGDPVTDANVWSDTLALDTARYYLRKNSIKCITTNLIGKLNPFIELNKLVAVNHNFFDLKHELFVVNSISFSGDSLEMSIGTTNIQTLTFLKAGDCGYVY